MSENGAAVAPVTGGAGVPVIELREIDVFYGRVNALSKVSMVVGQGEIVALIGSNGAGKTAGGFGGPKAAAEILNLVGAAHEGTIMAQIAKVDEPLSQKLQDLMFVFEDLNEVDDRGMQELLREVPGDKLIIALKAADEKLKEKFFKNMSERASQMMKDDLEAKGPVRLSEVEAAQKEILITARRMGEEGRLQLGGKGGEAYV